MSVVSEAQPYVDAGLADDASSRRRVSELARAHPAAVWLGVLISVSTAVRFALAYWMPAPWIFADELTYSELGKSFASGGSFTVRDTHGYGFGPLYPLLISPAYALFQDVPHAYVAIKGVNSLVMSTVAVPTFFLARRLVSRRWALAAAALTLAIPSFAYTGMVMTESLFFPLFLAAVLAMVRAFERPSAPRQLAVLALIACVILTRPQGVALIPALLTAILAVVSTDVLAEVRGSRLTALLRALGSFAPSFVALGAGVAGVAAWQVAHGRSAFASFGSAEGVFHQSYSVAEVARWFLYHLAELDLYSGVLPFAAFLLTVSFIFARDDRSLRVFAAVSISALFWLLVVVAAFVSRLSSDDVHSLSHIEDRYTFYALPLLLVALVVWVARRPVWPARRTALAAVAAAALPLCVPYGRLIRNDAIPDTFALLPWATVRGKLLVPPDHVALRVGFITFVLGALFYLLRSSRLPLLAPLLVLLTFIAVMSGAQVRTHGASAAAAKWIQSDQGWIDAAIGPRAKAVAIWSGRSDPHVIWEAEFFNRAVGPVYFLRQPVWQGLPEEKLSVRRRDGALVDAAGTPLRARFALVDPWVVLKGWVVARDRTSGMRLYRLDGATARIASK